jgi:hypothetical protein
LGQAINRSPESLRSPFAILCFLTLAPGAALLFLLAPSVAAKMAATTAPLSGGAVLFYQIALLCAALYARPLFGPARRPDAPPRKTALTAARALRWIALAAVPSALLHTLVRGFGVDAGAALALYVGTFLLAFYGPSEAVGRAARRFALLPILAGGLGLALIRFTPPSASLEIVALALVAFAFAAAGCHCELARRKPDASRLTFFALAVALGAALGGLAQGLFAPSAGFAAGLILAGLSMGADEEKNALRPSVLAALAALTLCVALFSPPPASDNAQTALQLRGLLD